jgi:Ca-activated chloride channel family protein
MTRLSSPFWLLLLLVVVARVIWLWRDRRARFGAFRFSSLAMLPEGSSVRTTFSAVPLLLEMAAMLLFVTALSRPQRVERLAQSERYGIDIVVALDASGSMAAEDFRPKNRFEVAKELISDFIDRRQDDRIGIVVFGARAATRVPITWDHDAAQEILARAEIGENGDGTAIGHAIATSVNRLRSSKAQSRVIILVTDGVNNSGSIEPLTAATLAAKAGIKIYTIGVGSHGEAPVPIKVQNPFTGKIETSYTMIRADLDEQSLTAIARMTNGEYFRATDQHSFGAVLMKIDALEKSRLAAPKEEKIEEMYPLPLTAAVGLLLLSLVSGETLWLKLSA